MTPEPVRVITVRVVMDTGLIAAGLVIVPLILLGFAFSFGLWLAILDGLARRG